MARSGKTAQEFIQGSFSPIVAVLCSPKVENVVSKNNLSFTELLQPFTSIDWEGQFREPGGSVCTVKNWKLIVRDVNWKPLQPTEARRQLNNAVLHHYNEKTVSLEIEGRKFDVPQSTPWFDAWRETYLEVQFPSDHEYTKHFLSCIIVGTTHDDNIIDTFNMLNQQYAQLQNVTPPKLPKWFNNEVLKSYLLLHDVSSVAKDKADAAYETLKQTFGAINCFMLPINSKSTVDPSLVTDIWAKFIKRTTDINTEMSSSLTTTPLEPQAAFPPNITVSEDNNSLTASTNLEGLHPLISTENDFYDNANSLQTHSFSGSSESVSVSGRVLDCSMEVHGAALNGSDVDAIKKFLQEYAAKALLPHLEKQISILSEGVATRKGVSRSLISATKRWFGTGKAGNTTVNNAVIYSSDCQELQLRRLGDLWFLCGQWQRAFDAYHTAKREFHGDSAWLCYAGALEMAAVSAFMAGEATRKTHGYMEESIVTYLNTCRMVQYAVRATLLSVLCLSSSGLHGEAAKQLIRMTSEDSDLRSAMLLEQAALGFLAGPGARSMCRKYAFHMVLAGHRFSKSGQKKHAYRCYKQAYQVYSESGWRLSTDHVQFALGRLAGALRRAREAARWLRAPLAPRGSQPPAQQAAFLREFVLAHQQWMESADEFRDRLPDLPLPLLEGEATSVLCVGPAPLSSPGRVPATSLSLSDAQTRHEAHYWSKMEEMLLQVAQGSVPMIYRPTVDLFTEKTDSNPVVPQGEPIQVSITLRNPLKISLVLKDVELLWKFVPSPEDIEQQNDEALNNEPMVAAGKVLETNVIYGQKIKSVTLEGDCSKILTFTLTPLRVGSLCIHGLAYKERRGPDECILPIMTYGAETWILTVRQVHKFKVAQRAMDRSMIGVLCETGSAMRLVNAGEGGNESGSVMIAGKVDLLSGVNLTDKRLQIIVIPHAPCLQMTFSETSTDVISGEMRSVDVEFRNVGPIDMRNLYMAVSHPDCVSLVTSDAADDDFKVLYEEKYREPSTYSDERAARAASWRRTAARHTARAAPAVARGGCARARLLLRPRARTPDLCLLAYYETGNRARAYRLLRHVFRFRVTEAVQLSITPRRSVRRVGGELLENMNLAVEVKNVCSGKDGDVAVEILEASLLSRQWGLVDLTAARNKDDLLISHERLHLVFKAKRILQTPPVGRVEYSRLKVTKTHQDSADEVNVAPYSKFVMEYKPSFLDTAETMSQKETKSNGLIQSMFVLRWKAHDKTKGRTTIGQHCLWLDCFTKAESNEREFAAVETPALQLDEYDSKSDLNDANKNNKDNVVVLRLEHSELITHNFKERKLCLVPITINIVNCYGVPVHVFIDVSKKHNRESFNLLGWAGALSTGPDADANELGVSVELDKFESRRVSVRAVCAAPGAYLVGAALAVSARRAGGGRAAARAADNTSLLVVQHA